MYTPKSAWEHCMTLKRNLFHYFQLLKNLIFLCCLGKITSPPDGTELTFLEGSSDSITWIFDDDISKDVILRTWSFTSSAGSGTRVLALLSFDTQLFKRNGILPAFDIKKPATLILNNVNQSYNGTYRLALKIDGVGDDFISDVTVFIASKFN
jgi:hypothetical protein